MSVESMGAATLKGSGENNKTLKGEDSQGLGVGEIPPLGPM